MKKMILTASALSALAFTACNRTEPVAVKPVAPVTGEAAADTSLVATDPSTALPMAPDVSTTKTVHSSKTSVRTINRAADKPLAAAETAHERDVAIANKPASQNNPDFSTEPHTAPPSHIGDTDVTGVDRTHKSAAKNGTFETAGDAYASQQGMPLTTLNLSKYPYTKKTTFKTIMSARLSNLDSKIDGLKGRVKDTTTANQSDYTSMLVSLKNKEAMAHQKLIEADRVSSTRWEGYKIEFRDSVADLERSFEQLNTAMK
jgi:hypothetical protein